MTEIAADRIASDPRYLALIRQRGRITWLLSGIMFVAYFAFILIIAFDKSLLARPIGSGVTSIGIVVGFSLILLAIALTGFYVHRAAHQFDVQIAALVEDER